jgi:hypothetical protein
LVKPIREARTVQSWSRFLIRGETTVLGRRPLISLALIAKLCVAAVASAQWIPNGFPVCDLPLCGGEYPLVCSDGAGGAFVVWVDYSHYATNYGDVAIQHLTASGSIASGWPVGGIIVSNAPELQAATGIVPDGEGGALFAWTDYRRGGPYNSVDIYAARITDSGTLATGWTANGVPVCTAPRYQDFAQVVSDGEGGAIIAWEDERGGVGVRTFFAQHLTAAGAIAPGWIQDGLPFCTSGCLELPHLAPDGAGGAIVAWADLREGDADVYSQRLTRDGTLAAGWKADGNAVRVAPGDQIACGAVSDSAGGAFIAWSNIWPDDAVAYQDFNLQRVTGAGTVAAGWLPEGAPILTTPRQYAYPTMAPDGSGGVVCTWIDRLPLSHSDVLAQRITPSGSRAPGWSVNGVRVNSAASYTSRSQLAPDGAGGAFLVFVSEVDGYDKIFGQHLTENGAVAAGWMPEGVLITAVSGPHGPASITADGFGGAITAWEDGRYLGSNIFAQRLVEDGLVPVAVALVSAVAEPDRVVLSWFAAAASLEATVYRRIAGSEWQALGLVTGDGSGHLRYEDREVIAGLRYAYRLGYREQGAELFSPETWVDVPAALSFALDGLRPNPALDEFAISFTLPTAARATLELFDASGRRLIAREVGSFGAGRHRLRLDEGARLVSGVYWIRLTQAGRVLTARGVVVR